MRISTDTIYKHERYGTVLVTGVAQLYDEYDTEAGRGRRPSSNVCVYFHDEYDGYGGMNPMPLSESAEEFAKSSEFVKRHNMMEGLE